MSGPEMPDSIKIMLGCAIVSGPLGGAAGMATVKACAYLLGRSVTYFPSIAAASLHGLISFSLASLLIAILWRLKLPVLESKSIALIISSVVVILPIYSAGIPVSLGTAALLVSTQVLGTAMTICSLQFLVHWRNVGLEGNFYRKHPLCFRIAATFEQLKQDPIPWIEVK